MYLFWILLLVNCFAFGTSITLSSANIQKKSPSFCIQNCGQHCYYEPVVDDCRRCAELLLHPEEYKKKCEHLLTTNPSTSPPVDHDNDADISSTVTPSLHRPNTSETTTVIENQDGHWVIFAWILLALFIVVALVVCIYCIRKVCIKSRTRPHIQRIKDLVSTKLVPKQPGERKQDDIELGSMGSINSARDPQPDGPQAGLLSDVDSNSENERPAERQLDTTSRVDMPYLDNNTEDESLSLRLPNSPQNNTSNETAEDKRRDWSDDASQTYVKRPANRQSDTRSCADMPGQDQKLEKLSKPAQETRKSTGQLAVSDHNPTCNAAPKNQTTL